MPVAGGGFEPCYNAQAAVAADSLLVVATDVVQAPNDKQQLEPMLNKVAALPEELGEVGTLLADNGYFSAANVKACEAAAVAADRDGPPAAPSHFGRALCRGPAATEEPHASRGDGAPAEDAGGQETLRFTQTGARTGVRYRQIGAGLPAIFATRAGQGAGRVEPCDHVVQSEADVRPLRSAVRPGSAFLVSNGAVKGRAGALRQPNRASDAQCAVIRKALAAHRRTRRCRHFGGRPESDRLLVASQHRYERHRKQQGHRDVEYPQSGV